MKTFALLVALLSLVLLANGAGPMLIKNGKAQSDFDLGGFNLVGVLDVKDQFGNSLLGGGGGSDSAANIGTGVGILWTKSGSTFQFKNISTTGGATVSSNANTVTISADAAGAAASATNSAGAWLALSNTIYQAGLAAKVPTNSGTAFGLRTYNSSSTNLASTNMLVVSDDSLHGFQGRVGTLSILDFTNVIPEWTPWTFSGPTTNVTHSVTNIQWTAGRNTWLPNPYADFAEQDTIFWQFPADNSFVVDAVWTDSQGVTRSGGWYVSGGTTSTAYNYVTNFFLGGLGGIQTIEVAENEYSASAGFPPIPTNWVGYGHFDYGGGWLHHFDDGSGLTSLNGAAIAFTVGFITNGSIVIYYTNGTPQVALPNGSHCYESTGQEWSRTNSTWVPINITGTGSGGSGTVTSVGVTVPQGMSVSGVPITGSGTAAITFNGGNLNLAGGGVTNAALIIATNQLGVGIAGGASPAITNVLQVDTRGGANSFNVNSNGDAFFGKGLFIGGIPVPTTNQLLNASGLGAGQYVATDANTNLVPTQNGNSWTNLDTHFTNYFAQTNIVLPADGNKWICLVTNGPHNFLSFGGNNMGAVSVWIKTNGDVQWPPQFSFLGYSNHLTTNCLIDFQPFGGTNIGIGAESEF